MHFTGHGTLRIVHTVKLAQSARPASTTAIGNASIEYVSYPGTPLRRLYTSAAAARPSVIRTRTPEIKQVQVVSGLGLGAANGTTVVYDGTTVDVRVEIEMVAGTYDSIVLDFTLPRGLIVAPSSIKPLAGNPFRDLAALGAYQDGAVAATAGRRHHYRQARLVKAAANGRPLPAQTLTIDYGTTIVEAAQSSEMLVATLQLFVNSSEAADIGSVAAALRLGSGDLVRQYAGVASNPLRTEIPRLEMTGINLNTSVLGTATFTGLIRHPNNSVVPARIIAIEPFGTVDNAASNVSFSIPALDSLSAVNGSLPVTMTISSNETGFPLQNGMVLCMGVKVRLATPSITYDVIAAMGGEGFDYQEHIITVNPVQNATCQAMDVQLEGSEASSFLDGAGIIGVILATLALAAMLMVGLVYRAKNEKDVRDKAEDPENIPMDVNPKFMQANQKLLAVVQGTVAPHELSNQGDKLWGQFRRCVSFDMMLYGNKPLKLSNAALVDIYALLAVKCPPDSLFVPLRRIGDRFLEQTVAPEDKKETVESILSDAVDFLGSSMADVMVERAIDLCTMLVRKQQLTGQVANAMEEAEAIYAMIPENMAPQDNEFLYEDMEGIMKMKQDAASDSHLDLIRAPYVSYGVKYIDPVSLAPFSGQPHGGDGRPHLLRHRRRGDLCHGCEHTGWRWGCNVRHGRWHADGYLRHGIQHAR